MTKEQFLQEEKAIQDQIESLNFELSELRNKYVNEHKVCNVGDMVEVDYQREKRKAFVRQIRYHHGGLIRYELMKVKKDGTPAKIREVSSIPGGFYDYPIKVVEN